MVRPVCSYATLIDRTVKMIFSLCAAALVCGSILANLAIAWVCAWFLEVHPVTSSVTFHSAYRHLAKPKGGAWAVWSWKRAGAHRYWINWYPELDVPKMDVIYQGEESHDLVPARMESFALRQLPTSNVREEIVIDVRGWPYPCFLSVVMMRSSEIRYGIPLQSGKQLRSEWAIERYALPLYPSWSEFLANTVFYLAVLIVIRYSYISLRSRARVRRGICPRCKYPLREYRCSECGWNNVPLV